MEDEREEDEREDKGGIMGDIAKIKGHLRNSKET